MRMSQYSNRDHYTDPETGVLKNRLGIILESELEKAEADFAGARSYELVQKPIKGSFDLNHLKAIHKYLFQDLYEWAGECREIDITKGGSSFARFMFIQSAAKAVFDELAKEKYLSGIGKADFCARAAHYLGEINALHPFREGNGRAQREFISQLAYKNRYYIEWKNISQDEMVQASIESFKGNTSKFVAMIRSNIRDLGDDADQPQPDKLKKQIPPRL